MTIFRSRFRPHLDDPGAWQEWELEPAELELVHKALETAAEQTVARLRSMFGEFSCVFGADALARSLAASPVAVDRALVLAKAVTALDYHLYRAAPPRPSPGGLTSRSNRKTWKRLRPHFLERLLGLIKSDVWQSLLWRSVYQRIPETWLPVALVERAFESKLVRLGPYKSIEVELDLNLPSSGGLAWIRENVAQSIEFIERALRERRPVLIELIRTAASSPLDADTLVVYCVEKTQSGDLRMLCYDPADAKHAVHIDAVSGEALCIRDSNRDADRPTVKALRVYSIDAVRPPLFGVRRYLDRLLPWKLFWSLKRRIVLLLEGWRDLDLPDLADR